MSLGNGTHLWNHHVFSRLQESKAKGVVQINLCKHLFSFSLVILSCLHHQWSFSWFPFLKSRLCIGFCGLPIGLLKGGSVVSFSWICDCISFERAWTSCATTNSLFLHSTKHKIYHFLLFSCCHFLCTCMIPTYFKSTLGCTWYL